MSDADEVFPASKGRGGTSSRSERRFITSRPRRGAADSSGTRVVEVVHVRRGGGGAADDQPRPAAWSVRTETWPAGFRAQPAAPAPHEEPSPAAEAPRPVVHVMPAWTPTPRAALPAAPMARTKASGRRDGTVRRQRSAPAEVRRFADPFAAGDDGANCLHCGYLVEPARERRGLPTCARCG